MARMEIPLAAEAGQGMVVASHYLAAQAGQEILRAGGNAVEAALTAAAVIAVVYPHMNSIGGDNFWLFYDAGTGQMRGINGSGRSGRNVSIETYHNLGCAAIPVRGYLAANTVPGAVSGWEMAFRYSQMQMGGHQTWASLLEPAIRLAADGFAISEAQVRWTKTNLDTEDKIFRNLQRFPGFCRTFLKPDGSLYDIGERFCQPELASSLSCIAHEGAGAFYRGCLAQRIAADLQAHGGLLDQTDFCGHRAEWMEPITVPYRDLTAWNLPPNTQGMASLEILNILQHQELAAIREGSADYYHLLIEAVKQAFADRDRWLTDPDFVDIPVDKLLSSEHGAQLQQRISMATAAPNVRPLDPQGDTIWLGVVDAQGNAVSLIQSIYHDFGSGIVVDGTGITLQNRGSFFSLDPHQVNCLMPLKRTFHTLNPAMLLRDGRPYMVYGTMGGEGQPQTQAALVTRIVDYGFDAARAVDAPRWLYGRSWGNASNDLKLEGRIPLAVQQELARRGHHVRVLEDYTELMGHAGVILRTKNGWQGSADPRSDGMAAGV